MPVGQRRLRLAAASVEWNVAVANCTHIAGNPVELEVLIVDDEPLIRWSVRHGLLRRGHHVVEAGDAAGALKALAADPERFDVVLLDYRLPDRQDLTLLSEIRRLAPRSAVWMMTAYGDQAMRSEAMALGVRAVVEKPFQVINFVSAVEAAQSL